jgi:hypothetical protein
MSAAAVSNSEWIDARTAAKILGVPGARNVQRLAERGMITTRDLPGVRAIYSRVDVEGLTAKHPAEKRSKPGMTYLFDIQPKATSGAGLARHLARYKADRDRYREKGPLFEGGDALTPGMTAFNFLGYLGELALPLVNHAIDRNSKAFLKMIKELEQSNDASQFWKTLARLQTEADAEVEEEIEFDIADGHPAAGGA